MAKFLNTILNDILVSLQTDYNVYEVFDVEDANVVLNDVQEGDFPIAFFSIKNNATLTLDRYKKTYPSYSIAVWLLNLYEEDNKSELETNYEGLRLDAMEFTQRFQRVEEFSRVPSNLTISPNIEEFDSSLDLLATALQISFTASVDIGEDTSRVCVPLNVSSFTVDDSDLDNVILDASASSFRGVTSGATGGVHAWAFTLDTTTISISGLATDALTSADIALLATIGIDSATGTYNSFTFNKNPSSLLPLNFVINTSHTYDLRQKGAVSVATIGEISKRIFISFNTSWDVLTDGNFEVSIATSDVSIGKWLLPDGTTIINNTLDTSLGGFDGTLKQVTLQIDDFSKVTSFIATGVNKTVGVLDLNILTNLSVLRTFFNTSITGVELANDLVFTILDFQDSNITSLDLESINATVNGVFDMSRSSNISSLTLNEGNNFIDFSISQTTSLSQVLDFKSSIFTNCDVNLTNSEVTSVVFGLSSGSIDVFTVTDSAVSGTLDFQGVTVKSIIGFRTQYSSITLSSNAENLTTLRTVGGVLNSFDFGGAVISSATTLFEFDNNNMSVSEVDNAWIEVDRVAIATGIARTLDGGGTNATPSATSLSARNSLIGKGYTLLI